MNNCPSLKQITLQRIAGQFINNSDKLSLHNWNKDHWKQVDKKFGNILKCAQKLELPKVLIEQLQITTKSMKREISKWIKFLLDIKRYHLTVLNLEIFCFNHEGRLDQEKSITFLIKNKELKIRDQYILACIYCLEDDITILWDKMSSHDKENFLSSSIWFTINSHINHFDLVSLWTSKLLRKFQNLPADYFSSNGFAIALQSENLAAVVYFWQLLSTTWKIEFLEDSEELLSQTLQNCYCKTYFADIFYFLFSQMNDRQQLNLLKYDALDFNYSLVCNCFLEYPYQKIFFQTINRMWSFLPLECYVNLIESILLKIADREDDDYNYHSLILEFWSLSPDNYKSYLRTESFNFYPFQKLFNILNFESADAAVIICIAENASDEEKEILGFDIHCRDLCCRLIEELEYELVELLIRKCISSKEKMRKFKQDILSFDGFDLWFVQYQNRLAFTTEMAIQSPFSI